MWESERRAEAGPDHLGGAGAAGATCATAWRRRLRTGLTGRRGSPSEA